MPQPEQFDVLILGSGFGGKLGLAYGAIGTADCRRRAPVDRRLLSQHRLPAQQKRDLERRGRTSGASRGAVRHGDRPVPWRSTWRRFASASATWSNREIELHLQNYKDERRRIDHGERAFCRAENARSAPQ